MGVGLPGNRDRIREKGLKLCQGRFKLDISENLFTERAVKHLHRLPRVVLESPSLEVFRNQMHVALGDKV